MSYYYFSMVRGEKEIAIEPLIYSGAFIAIYDLRCGVTTMKNKVDLVTAMLVKEKLEKRFGQRFIRKAV